MRIAVDAQGGKAGPRPVLDAAVRSARETGVEFLLCGPADPLRRALDSMGVSPSDTGLRVMDAPDAVGLDEDPSEARERPLSSAMVAAQQAAGGGADAFLATGNPGAALVASLWHMKKLSGVLRPALARTVRTLAGRAVLLDCGASPECKPWHLLQFALMGCAYARTLGTPEPRVGLLSSGARWGPWSESTRETLALLKHSGTEFVGVVDGAAFTAGGADVAVCDGLVGGACAGILEGAAALFAARTAAASQGRMFPGLRRRLLDPILGTAAADLRPGGAPLLGMDGVVVLSRGDEDAQELMEGIRTAALLRESGLKDRIRETMLEEVA